MPSLEKELRSFVADNFPFGDVEGFSNEDSLTERGILDSTGVLELVGFLEKAYGITVQDRELIPKNLDSIDGLVRFLERKLQVFQEER
jgi:acyl carrier protein